jgi:hypothetical protein
VKLVAVLGNGRTHALRLGKELEPGRALEYLSGGGARANYPTLDRDWLETEDGRWIRRNAIVELAVVNDERASVTASRA